MGGGLGRDGAGGGGGGGGGGGVEAFERDLVEVWEAEKPWVLG